MTDEEKIFLRKYILDTIGKPKFLHDPHDVSRLTSKGIEVYSLYLQDYGAGSYSSQNLMTMEPDLLDDFLEAVDLTGPVFEAADVFGIFHGPFGDCLAKTARGDSILINAIFGTVTVMKGGEDLSPIELEMDIITEIASALDSAADEQLIGLDGKNLRVAATKKHGPLKYGECYGFFPTISSGGDFDVENLKTVPLADHLLFLHTMHPFEVAVIDNPGDLIDLDEEDL